MPTKPIPVDATMRDPDQRAAIRHKLDEKGMSLSSSDSFERAFTRIKEAASHNGEVTDDRLRAIVDEAESSMEVFRGVADSYR